MPKRSSLPRLSQLLHLYLPAMLMAALALGTWWLVRSTPAVAPASTSPAVARQLDYEMEHFATSVYAATGQAEQVLTGTHLTHFNNQEIEIAQVRLLRQTPNAAGQSPYTQASAARAFGYDDGSDLTLVGQVQLQQSLAGADTLQLQGQRVRVYAQGERLQAQEGVRITRGTLSLQGQNMDWDRSTGVLTLQQRVRATVLP